MSSDNDYSGILFNRRHIVLNDCSNRGDACEAMGENPEWENRVCGKRKEWLARERPGGNELVVCGFMEEDLGSSFGGGVVFVYRGGLRLATEDRMSIKNKKAFEMRCSYFVINNLRNLFPDKIN